MRSVLIAAGLLLLSTALLPMSSADGQCTVWISGPAVACTQFEYCDPTGGCHRIHAFCHEMDITGNNEHC